jgi:hypothetical protein
MQNATRMWNLVFSNHTVELINNATVVNPSYTRDGKPSVVLDYGQSEAIIFRQFRDEMREVRLTLGPCIEDVLGTTTGHVLGWCAQQVQIYIITLSDIFLFRENSDHSTVFCF